MSDDTIKKSFIDPESGEEDIVQLPREINGWSYDPDRKTPAAAWVYPENEKAYIGWEKTGGHTYSAWVKVPGEIPRDTVYDSFGSAEEALKRAEKLMGEYTPEDVVQKNW